MTEFEQNWQSYCHHDLNNIEICLHAKKRMKMRAWDELKDLNREQLLQMIRQGRLIEENCGNCPRTYVVELFFPTSKICVIIKEERNQLATVYNEHYHYDKSKLENLPVKEQMRLRREAKKYHQQLEMLYQQGQFRGRKFKF